MIFSSFPDLEDGSNSIAFIIGSSGTTGPPKGICKSHKQLISHAFPQWSLKSGKQEVLFLFQNLSWVTSVFFLLAGTLYGGKRVITSKLMDADVMIDICNRYQVTTGLAPPVLITALLQDKKLKPFESMEVFISGGVAVSKDICKAIRKFLPNGDIYAVYGMTEADFVTDSFNSQRDGSAGKPSLNNQIKIIDDDEKSLGPNEQGEICIKSRVIFSGYFDDPEANKATIKNSWVYSGDTGYFDDDGFLFVVDRKKKMLQFDGCKVGEQLRKQNRLRHNFIYFLSSVLSI